MLQIPIRTFSEWQNVPVGTRGMDLVGHDGGSAQGEFAYTLLVTVRCTQWTEMRAVPNKAQILGVRAAPGGAPPDPLRVVGSPLG